MVISVFRRLIHFRRKRSKWKKAASASVFLFFLLYMVAMLMSMAGITSRFDATLLRQQLSPTAVYGPYNNVNLVSVFQPHLSTIQSAVEYNADAISNLDIPTVEYSDGFRSGMRAWNRTVQYWLATFVYRRTRKSIRMPYTMLVSAFWHGIHPGYFLSFLTIPLCTTAEDLLFRVFPTANKQENSGGEATNRTRHGRPFLVSVLWSFIRTRGFELLACGFLLLTWEDTIRLWRNLYFWLHATMILVIALLKLYLAIPPLHSLSLNNVKIAEKKVE